MAEDGGGFDGDMGEAPPGDEAPPAEEPRTESPALIPADEPAEEEAAPAPEPQAPDASEAVEDSGGGGDAAPETVPSNTQAAPDDGFPELAQLPEVVTSDLAMLEPTPAPDDSQQPALDLSGQGEASPSAAGGDRGLEADDNGGSAPAQEAEPAVSSSRDNLILPTPGASGGAAAVGGPNLGSSLGSAPASGGGLQPTPSPLPIGGGGGGAIPGSPSKATEQKPDDRLIKVKGLDKQQLCIDLLMVGCVQSFVDFFYITHRKSAPTESTMDQDMKDVDLSEDTLIFLKETLETAESARRAKNYHHCFENYNALSDYFEKVNDLKSAMYFYQRCSDVATEVDARESTAKANLNLGMCEEKGNNWKSAMKYHEKALQISTSADSLPLQIKAASRLTHVYQILAEQCEKESRDADATALYERCLSCAQLSKDASLEGNACHRLGLSKHKTGKYDDAIDLQKQYLEICRTHDDRIGESAARAALAHAYEAVDNTQEAIKQLENLLNVASEAGELKAQASACLNLGMLYNGRGDNEKSVELLEQHFDLARQLGDRKLIDSARVVLGMARGNGKLNAYIDLVNNDLDRLLKWKSKRMPLESQ